MRTGKLFLCLLILLCVMFITGEAMAAKGGGNPQPNQNAYQHANQNAKFLRDEEISTEDPAEAVEEAIEEEEVIAESVPAAPELKKVAPIGYDYDPQKGQVGITGLEEVE